MILGIIPARGGSKGVLWKNLYPLLGKPLIQYTIEAALKSKLDNVIVSTDNDEIAMCADKLGCKVIRRPDYLAAGETPMLPTIQHAVAEYELQNAGAYAGTIMILQPTSPQRLSSDINMSIELFNNSSMKTQSLISITEGVHPVKCYDDEMVSFSLEHEPYDKHKHRCFCRNGAIFITSRELLDKGALWDDTPSYYFMPKSRSLDIDTEDDMIIAEAMLSWTVS